MPRNTVIVNVNVGQSAGPMVLQRRTGCLMQLLYFCFIGCWLGALAVGLAYVCFMLVVTIPLGVAIINKIPYLVALRQPPLVLSAWGQEIQVQQHSFIVRAIWFIFIGLWLTGVWMGLAYVLCLTIIGMPAGFWMFDRAPAMLTLHKSQ